MHTGLLSSTPSWPLRAVVRDATAAGRQPDAPHDGAADSATRMSVWRRWRLGGALGAWGAVVAGGMLLLADYSTRPGQTGAAPEQIGAAPDGRFRLMMFVHPRCPCSMASVHELASLASKLEGRLDATAYLMRPETETDEWTRGSLREAAEAIPGVRVEIDAGGRKAERFGSKTSGDVLVYDAAGRLRYHGGITVARGHEGDNRGKSAVISSVLGDGEHVGHGPVFGCVLRSEREPRPN